MTPQRYLTLVRLQRAKDRLVNSFQSVQEMGRRGHSQPSHFTKSFKAAYGMTPLNIAGTTYESNQSVPCLKSPTAAAAAISATASKGMVRNAWSRHY
jgi:AraC-like DNA-binding protein